MKSSAVSFMMLVATIAMGYIAYKANADKKAQAVELAQKEANYAATRVALAEMQDRAETAEKAIDQAMDQLTKDRAARIEAQDRVAKLTKERDQLKRTIAFNKKSSQPKSEDNPPQTPNATPKPEPVKTGTLALPPGISKGGGKIKPPGE